MHDLEIVFVIEFVGRKDAEFVAGFEQGDGNHEDAGKRKCVALGECKILCHVRNLRPERADPARWLLKGPGQVAITAQAKTSGGSLLADPDSGLIDADPGLVQDAIHKERNWIASAAIGCSVQIVHGRQLSRASVSPVHRSAATRFFLIGQNLEDVEVHLGTRFYTGDFTGDLGPVPILMEVAFGAAAESASLRLIVSSDRISPASCLASACHRRRSARRCPSHHQRNRNMSILAQLALRKVSTQSDDT